MFHAAICNLHFILKKFTFTLNVFHKKYPILVRMETCHSWHHCLSSLLSLSAYSTLLWSLQSWEVMSAPSCLYSLISNTIYHPYRVETFTNLKATLLRNIILFVSTSLPEKLPLSCWRTCLFSILRTSCIPGNINFMRTPEISFLPPNLQTP